MPNIPTSNNTEDWQKYYAMECNNRAWSLSTEIRSPKQDAEMLDAAHASAFHWGELGTELNRMRAVMLLAEVHSLLNLGATAYAYAEEMLAYFKSVDSPDWELAFAYCIYAHAASIAGPEAEYKGAYENAVLALEEIEDPEDQKIVQETFNHVPKP